MRPVHGLSLPRAPLSPPNRTFPEKVTYSGNTNYICNFSRILVCPPPRRVYDNHRMADYRQTKSPVRSHCTGNGNKKVTYRDFHVSICNFLLKTPFSVAARVDYAGLTAVLTISPVATSLRAYRGYGYADVLQSAVRLRRC